MIDNEEESYSNLLQEAIEAQMHAQLESARMSVLTISENTQIQALFAQRDREGLLDQLLPVYEKIQTEVSQIQFHLPDSTSFLRLHMPEQYGDSLKDFRFTVNEANANLKIVQGLEKGVGGYGFRVVVPMFNEGVHTGSVEYGSNFGISFLENIKTQFGGEYFIYQLPSESVDLETSDQTFLAGTLGEDTWQLESKYLNLVEQDEVVRFQSLNERESVLLIPFKDYQGIVGGYIKAIIDRSDILNMTNWMHRLLYMLSAATAISLAVIILIFIHRSILKPLKNLQGVIKQVETGDFTVTCKRQSRDEIGELADSFNGMVVTMRDVLGNVKEASSEVSTSAISLQENADQNTTASEEVARAVQEIANGAFEQAKRTEQGSKQSIDLGDTIENNMQILHELKVANDQVVVEIEEGLKRIRELYFIFQRTENAIQDVQVGIEQTDISSEKIRAASNMISEVADRTNLLSLNAAIEAARAGEAGKGFAVVADEIRKLAESSSKSTQTIDEVINELRANSSTSVSTIQDSIKALQQLHGEILNSQKTYEQIAKATEISQSKMTLLNQSSDSMEHMKNQILDELQGLAAIAEENSASTQEVAASVEEQTASLEIISSSSYGLTQLALKLNKLVEQFKS